MANPHKGEVELVTKDSTYILHCTIDSICQLEDRLGESFQSIAKKMSNPETFRLSLVRDLLHAALLDHHPEITVKEAGELIPLIGGLTGATAKLNEVFAVAFQTEARGKPGPQNRRQRRAAATKKSGIGKVS